MISLAVVLVLLLLSFIYITYRLRFVIEAKAHSEIAGVSIAVRLGANLKIVVWRKEIQIIDELQRMISKAKDSADVAPDKVQNKTRKASNHLIERLKPMDVFKLLADLMRMDAAKISYSLEDPALLGIISGYANAFLYNFAVIYDMNRYREDSFWDKVTISPCFARMDNSFFVETEISIRPYQSFYHLAKLAIFRRKL